MIAVHKYVLDGRPIQDVETYAKAKFLHAAEQQGRICVWAQVNTSLHREKRSLNIVPTGGSPQPGYIHIGTVLLFGDTLVAHVYAEDRP